MAEYTIPTKKCEECSSEFAKPSNCSKKDWSTRKYCSRSCSTKAVHSERIIKYQFKKGSSVGVATRFTKGSTTGSKNTKWKGGKASYAAKHMWVRYHFGKADHCEDCGNENRGMYHWANLSKEYLRDRDDWKQLCVPCHKRFDLARL